MRAHLRILGRGGGGSLGGCAQVGQAGAQGFAAIEGARRRSWGLHRRAIAAIACDAIRSQHILETHTDRTTSDLEPATSPQRLNRGGLTAHCQHQAGPYKEYCAAPAIPRCALASLGAHRLLETGDLGMQRCVSRWHLSLALLRHEDLLTCLHFQCLCRCPGKHWEERRCTPCVLPPGVFISTSRASSVPDV